MSMHLNYHFLRFLAPAMQERFAGSTIKACFSQNKEELILEMERSQEKYYLRAHLLAPQVYIEFPARFVRAKHNSPTIFPSLLEDKILSFSVFPYERALKMELISGQVLVLKLHGNRSNALLYAPEGITPSELFKKSVKEDHVLDWRTLPRELNLSWEHFAALEGNASQFLPTLGKLPREWLKENGYPEAGLPVKWSLLQELLDLLDSPLFYLVKKEGEVQLSLLPEDSPIDTFSDPLSACNALYYRAVILGNFDKEKNHLLKSYQDQLTKIRSYLTKSEESLKELENSPPPSQVADVIMAHLHEFSASEQEVELMNFYTGKPIKIKLKPNQKPQDFAANLYRKSKNRQLEVEQLLRTRKVKLQAEASLLSLLAQLAEVKDFKGLSSFRKSNKEDLPTQKNEESRPFKVFEVEGYTIWVGKSAKDNDEMLREFVHKDDLWLHARQVPGSHVVVRRKGMPPVPQQVIERAGSLAAYYSKLKTDSLCPVILTEVKYVRKVKGSAPGSVIVDKEKVILVVPKGPDEDSRVKN